MCLVEVIHVRTNFKSKVKERLNNSEISIMSSRSNLYEGVLKSRSLATESSESMCFLHAGDLRVHLSGLTISELEPTQTTLN